MADLTVSHDADAHKFIATLDGEEVGHVAYRKDGDVYDLFHTETESSVAGQGFGTELVRQTLDMISDEGATVRPTCPFIANYLERNQDAKLADLIAPEPEH